MTMQKMGKGAAKQAFPRINIYLQGLTDRSRVKQKTGFPCPFCLWAGEACFCLIQPDEYIRHKEYLNCLYIITENHWEFFIMDK